jgi:hypothetical protein
MKVPIPGRDFAPNRRDDMRGWTRADLPVNGVQMVQNFGKPSEMGDYYRGRDVGASATRTTSANAPAKGPGAKSMYPLTVTDSIELR